MSSTHTVLQGVFDYERFRGSQEAIIGHVVDGGDALVLMPTGGGKSLCYQVPAIVRQQAVKPLPARAHGTCTRFVCQQARQAMRSTSACNYTSN